MMDIKSLPLDKRAQCAAYMRATHNMTQTEIGQVLGGLSQPHVSRLLAHAEKKNYLIVSQRFASEQFSNDWIRQMDELLAPSGLTADLKTYCDRLGIHTPRVLALNSGPGSTEGALIHRRNRFGRTASGRLIELISKSNVVGVAWGRTIKSVLDGIVASRQPLNTSEKTRFVAVCAELVSLAQHGYSSNRLAEKLDEIFNASLEDSPQLTGFPAYIPRRYDEDMRASMWRYISETPGYHRVFSGPKSLINQMDMLISSVGYANMPVVGSFEELLLAAGIVSEDLQQLVVGDLSGILIPKHGLSEAKQELIDDINAMWTGIRFEHVRAIAKRAIDDPSVSGVVAVAIQAERGDTLFELISRELVNELIIDHDAAERIHMRIKEALAEM